jgi:lipid-A-disaccharide synthase
LNSISAQRILVVTGEASGDLLASHLVKAMRAADPALSISAMGGEKLREAGAEIVCDISRHAVMGITEVIGHLGMLYGIFRKLTRILERDRPDLLILVDYPDFNLRLARVAKKHRIPVLYYVSPQIWAWRTGRIRQIAATVSTMVVVFPFELPLYREAGVDAHFVGHPLLDIVKVSRSRDENSKHLGLVPGRRVIGLLPGSRLSEVKRILPPLLEAARRLSREHADLQFIIPVAPGLDKAELEKLIGDAAVSVTLADNSIYDVIDSAYLVIVASGTASLETALLAKPMVIVYRMSPLSYRIARLLVQVPHIGMANIIAGKTVVPELIQDQASGERIAAEAARLLTDTRYYASVRAELELIKKKLGEPGASERAGRIALDMLVRTPSAAEAASE